MVNNHQMIALINEAMPKIEPAESEDIILVTGNTGAGKSTLINYLLGCEMEEEKIKGRRGSRAVPKDPKKEFAKIGHGKESETFYPAVYKRNDGFVFCDCPGFQDTRIKDIEILTYINMQLTVEAAKGIRSMVVVIDIDSFTSGRGNEIRKLVEILGTLLKKPGQHLSDSILFAITKADDDITIDGIIDEVDELIKSCNSNLATLSSEKENNIEEISKIQSMLALLNLMKDKKDNIIIVNVFDKFENQKKILEKLNQLKPIDKTTFDFNRFSNSRVKFNHVVDGVTKETIEDIEKASTLSKLISDCNAEISNTRKMILIKNKKMGNLKSEIRLSAVEKQREIDKFKNEIKEYEDSISYAGEKIGKLEKRRREVESNLAELDIEDLEEYWEDSSETLDKPTGFFQTLASFFTFWTKKAFVYNDVPFNYMQDNCSSGGFTDTVDRRHQGYYKTMYTSGFLSPGNAKIAIFLPKREIPSNKVQIGLLKGRIEKIKAAIDIELGNIADYNAAIEELNSSIDNLVSEHKEIKEENLGEIAKIDSSINKLNEKIKKLATKLDEYKNALKETEIRVNKHRITIITFLKVCFLLKINTQLVNDFVKMSLEWFGLPHPKNKSTLLHIATSNNWYLEVAKLIKLKTDVNLKDENGNTSLHYAIHKKYFHIAICLVLSGAYLDIKNNNNETPLELLLKYAEKDFDELAKELLGLMLYIEPQAKTSKSSDFMSSISLLHTNFVQQNAEFKRSIESVLADNIRPHNHSTVLDKSFHKEAFREMYSVSEFAPLLEIVRFAVLGLHELGIKNHPANPKLLIMVDPNKDDTSEASLGTVNDAYGFYYQNQIMLGGKRSIHQDHSKFLARGTLIHEITHFVANEVFDNNCNPYRKDDKDNRERFNKICQDIFARKDKLHERLQAVFTYPPELWHIELIVRIPQIIAMSKGSYDIVNKECPDLLAYYREVFLPACKDHIWILRQKHRILESDMQAVKARVFDLKPKSSYSNADLMSEMGLMPSPKGSVSPPKQAANTAPIPKK